MIIRKDDIRTFIVIFCVCAICVVLALILNIKSNYDRLEPVNEYNVFFSNISHINNYLNYTAMSDSVGVYNLLNEKYIYDNGIDYDNVLDKVNNYSGGSSIKVVNMDYVQIGNNFVYYVKGNIYENNFGGVKIVDDNFSVIIISDFNNLSYSLYPVDDNFKDVINDIKKINIENNYYNAITKSELINKEQVCVFYLSDFFDSIMNNIEYSYGLLSDDMKEIYTSVDEYKKYIDNNVSLLSSTADRCKIDTIDNKRVYTVIDSNENVYVFTEEYIMNYDVDFYLKGVNE